MAGICARTGSDYWSNPTEAMANNDLLLIISGRTALPRPILKQTVSSKSLAKLLVPKLVPVRYHWDNKLNDLVHEKRTEFINAGLGSARALLQAKAADGPAYHTRNTKSFYEH